MLHVINAETIIDMESETHYHFHEGIPALEYPQVHDFYEFSLVTEGTFSLLLGSHTYTLEEGDLIIIRPGEIHSKVAIPGKESKHINLAFLASTMESLFSYLYGKKPEEMLLAGHTLVKLSRNEKKSIQSEMEYLNLFPITENRAKRAHLRELLVEIIYKYMVPASAESQQIMIIPRWMQNLISGMQNQDNLYEGMKYLVETSGKTEEYVCRSFKKYFGITPTGFINNRRLNYVANMLRHSDRDIGVLCNDVGFASISYFYTLFRKEFGITPLQYRKHYQLVARPVKKARPETRENFPHFQ
ncbi:MAG: AraC family transcriptional regulator [Sphaerochaetaceae bacterium]